MAQLTSDYISAIRKFKVAVTGRDKSKQDAIKHPLCMFAERTTSTESRYKDLGPGAEEAAF